MQMMYGLVLGVIVGTMVSSEFGATYLQPLGQLFIRFVRFKDALASDVKVIAEESVHKHCDKADKRQYDTHKKTSRYNV